MAKKTSARATADATENPKSGPGDTSRPKVSPEVQLVWARVISRAESDSDFAAVLRDDGTAAGFLKGCWPPPAGEQYMDLRYDDTALRGLVLRSSMPDKPD